MKNDKIFCTIVLFFVILNIKTVYANEMQLQTSQMSKDDKESYWESYEVKFTKELPKENQPIEYFDINDDGDIAIVFSNRTIAVYDSKGDFSYSVTLKMYGVMKALWHENHLVIYDLRSDDAVEIDDKGNMIDIYDYVFDSTFDDFLSSHIRTIGDTKYVARNNLGTVFHHRAAN